MENINEFANIPATPKEKLTLAMCKNPKTLKEKQIKTFWHYMMCLRKEEGKSYDFHSTYHAFGGDSCMVNPDPRDKTLLKDYEK